MLFTGEETDHYKQWKMPLDEVLAYLNDIHAKSQHDPDRASVIVQSFNGGVTATLLVFHAIPVCVVQREGDEPDEVSLPSGWSDDVLYISEKFREARQYVYEEQTGKAPIHGDEPLVGIL
jgi:hypothetical protein